MATMTAQILVGRSHSYDGGLVHIDHTLLLTENGVARWTLYSSDNSEPIHSWIPCPDTMLEDGLLLLGLLGLKHNGLIEASHALFRKPPEEVTFINSDAIEEVDRLKLHQECRSKLVGVNLVFTVLHGSSIERQLSVLEDYAFEMEVCRPTRRRSWNIWTQTMEG